MSPNHSSVSPVSSGSGHSSPRSPTTAHTHLPPPSSQPPPLPSSQLARSHPPASTGSSSGKVRSTHSSKSSSRGAPQHGTGLGPRGHTHHPTGHVTSQPRSRKPYEHHMLQYPKHTVGPLPSQHSSGPLPSQHSSGPLPSQHSVGPLPSQHSAGPYQWVRPGGVGKPSHGPLQDAPPSTKYPSYEAVVAGNMSVVNSKVVPTKMYPTPQVINHSNEKGSPEHNTHEIINDPGERGSPSGESNPSSTPNSTLGKQNHRQALTESMQSSSESKLALGEVMTCEGREGHDGCEAGEEGKVKSAQQPSRGECLRIEGQYVCTCGKLQGTCGYPSRQLLYMVACVTHWISFLR